MHALVVDDTVAVRKFIRVVLESAGWQVSEAEDGIDAMEVLKTLDSVGLMFIDWHMPNMNGIELVKSIRAEPKFENALLVMATTESELRSMDEAFEAGVTEFMTKPFKKESIQKVLEDLFD